MSTPRLMLEQLAASLSDAELMYIAECDHGIDADLHLEALRNLVGPQHLHLAIGQVWYPLEVIELCKNSLKPGHEREFAFCTLFVLDQVHQGHDTSTDLEIMFECRAIDYDSLPVELRDAILAAYLQSGLR